MLERFSREYLRGKYHCTIDLLFDWFGLVCFENKNKNFCCHTADSKLVKQEINGTVILPLQYSLVFLSYVILIFARKTQISYFPGKHSSLFQGVHNSDL